jgi:hypothetical protein
MDIVNKETLQKTQLRQIFSKDPNDLSSIRQRNVNLVEYARPQDRFSNKSFEQAWSLMNLESNEEWEIEVNYKTAKAELGHNEFKQRLQAKTAQNFTQLFLQVREAVSAYWSYIEKCDLRVRLNWITTDMCSGFHIDNNDYRLLCTLIGPGTIWLRQNDVNYEALENYDHCCIQRVGTSYQQVKTGSFVVIKGQRHPLNKGMGLVHKSPQIEEQRLKRLLLTIN